VAERAYGRDLCSGKPVSTLRNSKFRPVLTMRRNVVNVFKTPGKLRGRTPYTAKKRANQLNRAVCNPLKIDVNEC
jgi:hypothetical protein